MKRHRSSHSKKPGAKKNSSDVQIQHALAGSAYAGMVRKTYGPMGRTVMLFDKATRHIEITNDTITIMNSAQPENPVARMVLSVAKVQDAECGNGTTGAAILTGELLKHAIMLLEQGITPRFIVAGYNRAVEKACAIFGDFAQRVQNTEPDEIQSDGKKPDRIKPYEKKPDEAKSDEKTADGNIDRKLMKEIAVTAMASKVGCVDAEILSGILIPALIKVTKKKDGKLSVELDDIHIVRCPGGATSDSRLLEGMVLEKGRIKEAMPRVIKHAKLALISNRIELKKTIHTTIQMTQPEDIKEFLAKEERMVLAMYEAIAATGANALFCAGSVNERIVALFAKNGIMAFDNLGNTEMQKIAKATGGTIVKQPEELNERMLGKATHVEEKTVGDKVITEIIGGRTTKSVSLILRGGTLQAIAEKYRALHDAAMSLKAVLEDGRFIAGGGAPYIEASKQLRTFARGFSGKEQYAIESFADALEALPKALVENAGLNVLDVMAELKKQHEDGKKNAGINLYNGKIEDMIAAGIIESPKIAQHALRLSVAVTSFILRVDGILSVRNKQEAPRDEKSGEE